MRMRALILLMLPAAPLAAQSLFVDGFEAGAQFVAASPMLEVEPGAVSTRCYHFRAPAQDLAVRRITTTADANVRRVLVYGTYDAAGLPIEVAPPGTVTECGAALTARQGWLHVGSPPEAQTDLPADDGAGKRLAFVLAPGQPLVLQASLLPNQPVPIAGAAAVTFESWNPALPVTPTASYLLNNVFFSVPPGGGPYTVSESCLAPLGVRFWRFTTRTNGRGTHTEVRDGNQPLVEGSNWLAPPVVDYGPPAFRSIATNLGYRCTFLNDTNQPLQFGEDEANNETCIAVGWFFPATRPLTCYGSGGPE